MFHCGMVLIISLMLTSNYEFIILQLVAGMVAIQTLRELSQRSQIVRTAFIIFLVYVIFFLTTLLGGRSLRRDPPEIRLMKKAFRALARRGIPAGTGETPAAFAARLSLLSSETAVPDPAQKQPGNRKELSPASLKLIAGEFAALAYEFSLMRYGKTPKNHKERLRGLRIRADKIVKICTTS